MKMIELDLSPDRARLRQFGWVALGVFGLLAGWAVWRGQFFGVDLAENSPVPVVLGALAGISGLFSLVWPVGNRALYTVMTLVAWPIGTVVSYIIMLILFYIVLTPVGLVFRLMGRDALHRKIDPQARTYWVDHQTPNRLERYFRQF